MSNQSNIQYNYSSNYQTPNPQPTMTDDISTINTSDLNGSPSTMNENTLNLSNDYIISPFDSSILHNIDHIQSPIIGSPIHIPETMNPISIWQWHIFCTSSPPRCTTMASITQLIKDVSELYPHAGDYLKKTGLDYKNNQLPLAKVDAVTLSNSKSTLETNPKTITPLLSSHSHQQQQGQQQQGQQQCLLKYAMYQNPFWCFPLYKVGTRLKEPLSFDDISTFLMGKNTDIDKVASVQFLFTLLPTDFGDGFDPYMSSNSHNMNVYNGSNCSSVYEHMGYQFTGKCEEYSRNETIKHSRSNRLHQHQCQHNHHHHYPSSTTQRYIDITYSTSNSETDTSMSNNVSGTIESADTSNHHDNHHLNCLLSFSYLSSTSSFTSSSLPPSSSSYISASSQSQSFSLSPSAPQISSSQSPTTKNKQILFTNSSNHYPPYQPFPSNVPTPSKDLTSYLSTAPNICTNPLTSSNTSPTNFPPLNNPSSAPSSAPPRPADHNPASSHIFSNSTSICPHYHPLIQYQLPFTHPTFHINSLLHFTPDVLLPWSFLNPTIRHHCTLTTHSDIAKMSFCTLNLLSFAVIHSKNINLPLSQYLLERTNPPPNLLQPVTITYGTRIYTNITPISLAVIRESGLGEYQGAGDLFVEMAIETYINSLIQGTDSFFHFQ